LRGRQGHSFLAASIGSWRLAETVEIMEEG
jgi:hypothetical protein